ncbi:MULTISPECIES: S1 RNA-binding domain-containing protein [Deferrisoma]
MTDEKTTGGVDEAPETQPATREEFARLLEGADQGAAVQSVKPGDKVRCRVARVADDWVFVDLGGKQEGSIRREEFEADALPSEGQEIEAYVVSTAAGEVVLTTKLSARDLSKNALAEAHQAGIPVEGKVVKVVKGGYEVRVGGLRAFCPHSQIDLRWTKEPEVHVGQTYAFKVLEYKEGGRNVVLSRRALLEEERAKKREELRTVLEPGAVVTGRVRAVHDFGAFVEFDGVDGLIPVSEMSWGRVESPTEVVRPGDEVTVKVIAVDWEKDRVTLSLKELQEDPWTAVATKYQPGQRVQGRVTRIAPFGAFVELEPGVEGLVHISALGAGRRVRSAAEVVSPGEAVEVEVVSVDPEARRISLSLEHRLWESMGPLPRPGEVLEGTVEKVAPFGVFVKLPSGHVGLVHNTEMGTPKGTDHAKAFRPGDPMQVAVLGVEDDGRKIRLSRQAVDERAEREALEEYSRPADSKPAGPVFGTLGDLLKEKLKKG